MYEWLVIVSMSVSSDLGIEILAVKESVSGFGLSASTVKVTVSLTEMTFSVSNAAAALNCSGVLKWTGYFEPTKPIKLFRKIFEMLVDSSFVAEVDGRRQISERVSFQQNRP